LERLLPFFEVCGPNDEQFTVELTKDHMTIGRYELYNDIALEPDPQQLVSRKVHCTIERDSEGWWVIDNGSVNGTFLFCDAAMVQVDGRALLREGDSIYLLGKLTEKGEPIYWKLAFSDPLGTRPAGQRRSPPSDHLEYDWLQAKLFRIENGNRQEISNLRPQEHKLIRYMDQRNRANGNMPVMCTFEELQAALWGDEVLHTEAEINYVIFGLRKKIETDQKQPQFLETVRGLGYRLVTRPVKK
jgi:DNA-binding winged helix-turn-helix (wHTH) protein